ncbi:MAG: type IV pili methyl-accepting chemotaxis transducer N-terminal domain-containing protein, partial [Planctomycetota bacterium]
MDLTSEQLGEPVPERPRPAVIRGIVLRLLLVLGLLAGAATTQFVLNGSRIAKLQSKAAVINLAGRQRMLILRASLLSEQLANTANEQERRGYLRELLEVGQELEEAQTSMLHGNPTLGIPSASPRILAIYEDEPYGIQSLMRQFRQTLATQPSTIEEARPPTNAARPATSVRELLAGLEAVVSAYEAEFEASVRALQIARVALYLGTLSLLAVSGIGVFWPM